MHETWMVYSIVATKEEAISIAHSLLQEQLVACVNLHEGIDSFYVWQGEMHHEREVLLLAKTSAVRLQEAIERIKALHSHDVPCILAFPADKGFAPFMQWVGDQTRQPASPAG